MPHGHCFQLRPEIVYPYVGSNSLTALCYFILSGLIGRFWWKKKPKGAGPLFLTFALFILFCGIGHVVMVVNVWKAYYHLEAIVNSLTAFISLATVLVAFQLWPSLLSAPTTEELTKAYQVGLAQNEVFLDAFIVHNGKEILHVNEGFTKLFGWKEDDVVGSFYDKLQLWPDDQKDMIARRVARKQFGAYTTVALTKDGTRLHVIVNAKSMDWKHEDARAVTFRNITPEVELRKMLAAYQEREEGFSTIKDLKEKILLSLKVYELDVEPEVGDAAEDDTDYKPTL